MHLQWEGIFLLYLYIQADYNSGRVSLVYVRGISPQCERQNRNLVIKNNNIMLTDLGKVREKNREH